MLLVPTTIAHAKPFSKTAKAGPYQVTLKVLPVESFTGAKAEMVHDGGAAANKVDGPEHPDHHLVAFIKEKGKPVEDATVAIEYRQLSGRKADKKAKKKADKTAEWMTLPVARMHVAGKGLETTHYGNNVKLDPGRYEARVTVGTSKPATFHFTIKS